MSTAYSARNESLRLSVLLCCLCLALVYGDWTWRWDKLIYDAQSSLITHEASDDIVIVAIDENSLSSIGRWPWPRDIHARLIDKLTQHQAKAVLIDVIFSEPSIEQNHDQQLAQSIENNEKVALPVLLEQTRVRGQLLETLPIPILTRAANNIGHVHIELDQDGIARGTYLYEGLGEARWPHIGLSILSMLNKVSVKSVLESATSQNNNSPWIWKRKHHFLIPFVGPPGSFKSTSYINVLNDQVLPQSLKNKIVLVGVTAAGLGDSLPTPVSGQARAMPGIEINANIIQAIQSNTLIQSISSIPQYCLAAILVILPILLFPYLSPRLTILLVAFELVFVFCSTLIVLHWFRLWIPISSILICLLLSYPLWAWRRLEFTVKYLDSELQTLTKEANEVERYVAQDSEQSFITLKKLVPITGISIFTIRNESVFTIGDSASHSFGDLDKNIWSQISDSNYATLILIDKTLYIVSIIWNHHNSPDAQQSKVIKTYIRHYAKPQHQQAKTTVEIIESRIRDIQATTEKLTYLREFITDSFNQMTDGVIVVDSLGTVTLANRQAVGLIGINKDTPVLYQAIQPLLNTLILSTNESWETIISTLLNDKHYENIQVRTHKNKDLIINISPLCKSNSSIAGFIINLSDITEIKDAQRRRDETLSFLSHDLRSPLVSILALLEMNKLSNPNSLINERIEKNINQTIQLAEDFVHLSRVESSDDIIFDDINMSDIIANAVDSVWDQATIKDITIKQDLQTVGWLTGNGAILERVIINLLTNAIKYSHTEGQITINLIEDNLKIICCIKDNGPGIDEREIPYLFDRFKRAKQQIKAESNIKSEKGIGLGLAFVHASVERHHGVIAVESELGKGSKFCIKLPALS